MGRSKKPNDFFKTPQYRGGVKAMRRFIAENLNYPEEALKNRVEGTVDVSYVVDGRGKVIGSKVTKGLSHGCDEEAIRLVNSLVFEKAINRGYKTTSRKTIKIHFKLPKRKPQPTATQFNYRIVSAKPQKMEEPTKKKSGYNITLNITSK